MNAMSREWIAAGNLSDIPKQGARRIQFGDKSIAVFRTTADRLFAIEDKCPHKEGPLSQGIVHGNCVTCPLHNWVISLETGEAQGADNGAVLTYRVRASETGEVLLCAADIAPTA